MSDTKELPLWDEQIKLFSEAVGKTPTEIEEALKIVVGEKSEEALQLLADPTNTPDEDLRAAFADLKIPSAKFKAHLSKLRGTLLVAEEKNPQTMSLDVLPSLPDDDSFVTVLKTGGDLKVGKTEVLSAIKAAIADKVGLFELPNKIKEAMEKFSLEQEEPVSRAYYDLQKIVTERSYADVLTVLGISGNFMTDTRKTQFLTKMNLHLWETLHEFHNQLKGWIDNWNSTAANPTMLMAAIAGKGGVNTAMMMAPPATDSLRDSAEAVVKTLNKVFAGHGIAVSRALAYEATRIKKVLEEKDLPAMIGATTREQMLKTLGIGIGSDYVRFEQNITRFMMSIMEYDKIAPASNEEQAYLMSMYQLGNIIPWDKFEGSRVGQL